MLILATTWPERLAEQRSGHDEVCLAHVMADIGLGARVTEINLEPLTGNTLAPVVREFSTEIRPEVVEALCQRAEGSPLFLRLLLMQPALDRLRRQDRLGALTVADVQALPATIAASYRELWDHLPPSMQATLAAASWLGVDIVVPLAEAAARAIDMVMRRESTGWPG